jgi:hypothetical protein
MNFNEQLEISEKAREALDRIRSRKNEKTTQELLHETRMNFNYAKAVFEEYTDDSFVKKVKFDSYVYENLLKDCPEENLPQVQQKLSTYLGFVQNIYEHINIEPKIHGFNRLTLESSQNDLSNEGRRIIYEHLDNNYYSLSSNQRAAKYKDSVINTAKDLIINEDLDVADSVEHSYKSAIIANLLESIAFPFVIKNTINDLLSSPSYKEVFDSEKLEELYEGYNSELNDISRILSLVI